MARPRLDEQEHRARTVGVRVTAAEEAELRRIRSNLNQIARWPNIYRENAEAVEVIVHLVAIERALDTLAVRDEPR